MQEKKYLERNGQTFKIQLYYSLGGMNYFQSVNEKRGYYFSVTPVKITKLEGGFQSEQSTAFSGTKVLILETKRQSQKGFNEAKKLVEESNWEEKLIENVIKKNNF